MLSYKKEIIFWKTLFIGLLLFCIISIAGFSQEKMSFSLKEAQDYAIKNNLNVRSASLDVEIARKKIWETTAIGLPQVIAGVSYTNNLLLATTLIPNFFQGKPDELIEVKFGTQHNANANISANQLVFNGPYIVGLQAASIFKKFSEQNLEKSEILVKEMVIQNFYLVLLSEETVKMLKANYENLSRTLFETRELYKNGFAEETDVDQLQVTVTSLENNIRSMKRQLEVSLNLLKYQMGLDQGTEIILTENLGDILLRINLDVLLTENFQINKHIDFKLMDTQEKLALLNLKKEKAEYLPSLSAFYTNQRTAMRNEFNFFNFNEKWFESSMLGFSFNIPIFSSGSKRSKISQKRLELEKSIITKQLLEQGLILENQQARYDFSNALEKYKSEKENVNISKKVADRMTIKYKQGVASSLELTQTNNQYLQTQGNLTTALVELLNAKVRLDKALNKL